jgi:hypothetical protein
MVIDESEAAADEPAQGDLFSVCDDDGRFVYA